MSAHLEYALQETLQHEADLETGAVRGTYNQKPNSDLNR